MANDKIIWDYLKGKGFNDFGTAGIMGNLQAESGLIPNNMQNSFEKKLGFDDASYTAAVDNGTYTNFVRDSCGYGLAQWTYWSRKQALLEFCKARKVSIGNLNAQLDFLYQELTSGYPQLVKTLQSATSVLEASNAFLLQFERPASKDTAATQQKRAGYGQAIYDKFVTNTQTTVILPKPAAGGNSPLVTYTNLTKNYTSVKNKVNDTITIHCIVGQWTAKQGCDYFANTGRQASANYVVGKDGSIGLCVEEKNRAWTTGGSLSVNGETGSANDFHAVTIEVASDTTHPYAVTSAAYEALIRLCADICQRNNIKQLIWKADKNLVGNPSKQNMTAHRWFAAKACPGEYLYTRFGDIANRVNELLKAAEVPVQPIGPAVPTEEDEDMTQEKFNEMMNNYLVSLANEPATWEQASLNWATQSGIMKGDEKGNLMPKKFMTRGEAVTLMQRLTETQSVPSANYLTKEQAIELLKEMLGKLGG